jgi:general secretion pathway protein B
LKREGTVEMSLILEALKKAERKHQLGEVPGIRPGPVESQPSGFRGLSWIMLLLFAGSMLGIGLYLGGYWKRPVDQQMSEQVSAVKVPGETQPSVELKQKPEVKSPEPATDATSPEVAEKVEPVIPPAPKPKHARPLSDMPSGFVANLPALNIDIHSYDRRPAKRYVLINLEKYLEGDYLAEGPLLVEILTDGVVLEHLGQRFILPIGNQ